MALRHALLLSFALVLLPLRLMAGQGGWERDVRALLVAGDFAAAENKLLALGDEAGAYAVHFRLGQAYLGLGLPIKARAEFEASLVLTDQPNQKAPALAGLALVALLQEDIDHARRLADQAASVDDPFVKLAQGFVALAERRPADARKIADALIDADAEDSAALLLGACSAAYANDFEGAETYLDRLAKVEKNHPFLSIARAVTAQIQHSPIPAIAAWEAARRKLPAHARLAVEEARLLVSQNRLDEAVRCLEEPLAASPELAYLLRERATIYLQTGVPGRAAEDLETIVARQKALTDDFLQLAEAYREMRDHERWAATGKRLENERPNAPEGPHLTGACLDDQGDTAGALQAYERALRRDPYFAPTLLARADLLMRQRKLAEARRDAEALQQAHAEDERGLVLLASIELLQERPAEAERLLREALTREPGDVEAQLLLGLALEGLGRHEEAIALQSALATREWSPLDMVRGLSLMHEAGQNEEVVELATRFLEDHPRDYGIRALLIDSLVNLNRHEEALAAIDQHVGYWGSSSTIELLRARCLAETGKLPEALALLDAFLRETPGDLRALYLRGTLRQKSGDLDGALTDLVELAKLDTEAAAPRLALARLFLDRHEYDRARAEAWLYQRRTTQQLAALRLRGQVELAAGKYQEAVNLLTEALKLAPNDVPSLEMRAKSYEALGLAGLAEADRRRAAELQGAPQ